MHCNLDAKTKWRLDKNANPIQTPAVGPSRKIYSPSKYMGGGGGGVTPKLHTSVIRYDFFLRPFPSEDDVEILAVIEAKSRYRLQKYRYEL